MSPNARLDVRLDVEDRVAVVTLDRPQVRNALSARLLRELSEVLEECDRRDDVDVVVLTGADPAFCAGLDLRELGDGTLAGAVLPTGDGVRRGPVPALSVPVIGAVNGVAVTGGLELALACDLLIASERARFADTHARIGVMPGWGLTVLLPEAVGVRRARQMSLTGNYVDASTALTWGLVNEVVPHDRLMPRALELARDVADNDRSGVGQMLRTYREGADLIGGPMWQLEGEIARSWRPGGAVDPDEVARRRDAVIARGRRQQGGHGA
jgi:enoyl-CoA hydratase